MDELLNYARSFLGTPYVFSGNYVDGLDCSGFVCEILRSAGVVGNREDLTAQDLFDRTQREGTYSQTAGSLAFFGKSFKEISHVALCLNPYQMIEAGGGDGTTINVTEAKKKNAFVRIRPINYRSDVVAVIKPRYNRIGLI